MSTIIIADDRPFTLMGKQSFVQGLGYNVVTSAALALPQQYHGPAAKLTFSERKILELIGEQHTTKSIARLLFITEKTVENHRSEIMEKLNLPPEKNALLLWAVRNNIK